jgi:hypothetical protein
MPATDLRPFFTFSTKPNTTMNPPLSSWPTPRGILAAGALPPREAALLIGGLVVLVGALLGLGFLLKARNFRETYGLLAERLGFQLQDDGEGAGKLGVTGRHRGRNVRFFTYYAGIGDKRRTNIAVAAPYAGRDGFSLFLYPNFAILRGTVKARRPLVRTGDEAFDRAYFVKSSDPALAQTVLTPEIRDRLLALDAQLRCMSNLFIENGEVRYPLLGAFRNPAQVAPETLTGMLDLVCGVAERVEKGG